MRGHSLLDGLRNELFVTAHGSVQLIISRLHPFGLVKADLGERAGKESDGHVDGGYARGVGLRWDDGGGRAHSQSVADRPVLDGIDKILLLDIIAEGRRVDPAREGRHVSSAKVRAVACGLGRVLLVSWHVVEERQQTLAHTESDHVVSAVSLHQRGWVRGFRLILDLPEESTASAY